MSDPAPTPRTYAAICDDIDVNKRALNYVSYLDPETENGDAAHDYLMGIDQALRTELAEAILAKKAAG